MADLQHLYLHGKQYYYDRKIPEALRPYMAEPFTGKARYRARIGTSNLAEAQRARAIHGAQFELALEKARKTKEGRGEDDTVRRIDALALELHQLEDEAPLPDEALEAAVAVVSPSLRSRFWKVKNEGKGENAPRLIPIHEALVSIFTRRANHKSKGEWLIEDLPDPSTLKHGRQRGAALSQAFTRYRRKVGVDRVLEGKRNAQTTFHSFRHYVATKLKEAGVAEEVRDALQGWARGGAMRDRYAVSADMMRQMREALTHLKLPG